MWSGGSGWRRRWGRKVPCGCVLMAYMGFATILDGTPGTFRYEIERWSNDSWGLHNIQRDRMRGETAVRADGSRSNRVEQESFRYFFVPTGKRWVFRSLYLRSEGVGYQIDEEERTVSGGPCGCTWEDDRVVADDGRCSRAAARYGMTERVGYGRVIGYEVARYQSEDGYSEIAFSTGLGCQVMEKVETTPGTLGIPGSKWHYRLTGYTAGEPDAAKFRLPEGYRVMSRPM